MLVSSCSRLASCIIEWRIHLSMSLVGRALLSLRRVSDHLDSVEAAGTRSAFEVLAEFHYRIGMKYSLTEALSQWYFQCQMFVVQSTENDAGTELSLNWKMYVLNLSQHGVPRWSGPA